MHSAEVDPCNVFVKYIPPDMSDDGLLNLFSQFGHITSAKVMVDHSTGRSLGYGFVRYSTPESAQTAISHMNGYQVRMKTLLCKLSNCTVNVGYPPNAEPSNNLYVKPLLMTTTEDDLRSLFSPYGHVTDVKVMVDKNTGASRQIGFVRFGTIAEAAMALNQMNGKQLEPSASPLVVKYAESQEKKQERRLKQHHKQQQLNVPMNPPPMPQPQYRVFSPATNQIMVPQYPISYMPPMPLLLTQPEPVPAGQWAGPSNQSYQYPLPSPSPYYVSANTANLFVFHLPSEVDDRELYRLFVQFGALESVKVMTDRNSGQSKGYGFVKFHRAQDAMHALSSMNGYQIGTKHLKVSLKTAGPARLLSS